MTSLQLLQADVIRSRADTGLFCKHRRVKQSKEMALSSKSCPYVMSSDIALYIPKQQRTHLSFDLGLI